MTKTRKLTPVQESKRKEDWLQAIRIPITLCRFSVACMGLAYRVNELRYTLLRFYNTRETVKPVFKKTRYLSV
jgi:hypothetical protein